MAGITDVKLMVMERFTPLSLDRVPLPLNNTRSPEFRTPPAPLTLRQVVALSITERHRILAGCLPGVVADLDKYPELQEFSILDGLDWDPDDD
jgi:hypothetical protein